MTNATADDLPGNLPPVPLMPPAAEAPGDAQFGERAPPSPPTAPVQAQCANCGTQLLGPHCYACGQPVKGMVRHLSSILADAADSVLNIDSRIFRTLLPLYFRPGYLTVEYFAGRRVRYVTPFRLYFFLSIAAFFLIQIAISDADVATVNVNDDAADRITQAATVEEVIKQRDIAIAAVKEVQSGVPMPEVGSKHLTQAIEKIQKKADKRVAYLKSVEDAKSNGKKPPEDPNSDDFSESFSFNGTPWDAKTNPIHFGLLPQFANDKVNQFVGRAKDNLGKIAKDPRPFVNGTISVLPQVLFVLMPLFALLLKIFYVFKRRLYMEHLIVALHSHAFIFMSLLLLVLVGLARTWAKTAAPAAVTELNWLLFGIGWWLPIYLLLMQKKVYKQGWILTVLKYGTIGIGYTILVSFAAAAAFLVSLGTT